MARETHSDARVACEGPRPALKGAVLATVARGPVPRDRCMARGTRSDARVACEGPRPALKGAVLATVARGPVPREFPVDRSMARDRPSPYVKRSRSGYRSAGACPPRSLDSADDGEGQALALR